MADVSVFNLSKGAASDAILNASITTGAATAEIPCEYGKDDRKALRVENANDTEAATITLKAGDGVCKSRGDVVVTVPALTTTYINLSETARTKDLADDVINMTVAVASGGALSSVKVELVQL
jgi:hypothetical protein